MAHAIRVHEVGGPEVLRWEEVPTPTPGAGEVLVRTVAVGLNFIDVYHRTGRYPVPMPFVLGQEGAGVVEAVGPDVTGFAAGDRVGYAGRLCAYAEFVVQPADRLVKLPDAIDERQAAAMLLKGMTAEFLLCRMHRVAAGETILVHAAAGGLGQVLCQWAAHLGATVIGTVGSAAKRAIAERVGCAHVVVLDDTPDFAAAVRAITGGAGVSVVYDGVGATTFAGSLDCLAPFGLMAVFGASSGPVPPLDVLTLTAKGSLFLTRPTLHDYIATPQALQASAAALFEVVAAGGVKVEIGRTYPLRDAAQAHADLEARRLTGSTLLLA